MLNDAQFGVALAAKSYAASADCRLDYIKIIAYFGAAGGPTGVKTINDLAIASVKTINDLAIGSVKTING